MTAPLMSLYQEIAEANLSKAESLPLAIYHDHDVYKSEVDRIFHNDWVFICPEAKLKEPGTYFALTLAGEPLAIIRGQDGAVRTLSNICRHRGTPLLDEGYGEVRRNIVCPYHAWTYDDEGSFRGAPMTGDVHIEPQDHCLPVFATEIMAWPDIY